MLSNRDATDRDAVPQMRRARIDPGGIRDLPKRGPVFPRGHNRAMHGGLGLALVFLLAAVIAVPVFKRVRLGAVLGYLAAGVALGPFGLGVVSDAAPVLAASEIGVVMLLFVIGLELSPARLRAVFPRRPSVHPGSSRRAAPCGVPDSTPPDTHEDVREP